MNNKYIVIFNTHYFNQGQEEISIYEEYEKPSQLTLNAIKLKNIKTNKNFIFFDDQLYYYIIPFEQNLFEVLKSSDNPYRIFGPFLKNLDVLENLLARKKRSHITEK